MGDLMRSRLEKTGRYWILVCSKPSLQIMFLKIGRKVNHNIQIEAQPRMSRSKYHVKY